MLVEEAYSGLRVLELGTRLAAGGCGTFLCQTGADVTFVDLAGFSADIETKHDHRAVYAAGKAALSVDLAAPDSVAQLARLVSAADIIITSSDCDPSWPTLLGKHWANGRIVCDITACGTTGPLAGAPLSDFQIQAMTGLIDTNGDAAEPPSRIALPVTECLAALHAFGGIGAAVWLQHTHGLAQNVEIALFDCAFAASASFLAKFVADGETPKRVGNRHPMTLPWNVYKASDEWVLICTSSNDHWQRLAGVMGDRSLIEDDQLRTAAGRARRADELDVAIAAWVSNKTAEECVEIISDLAIPCATIAPFDSYPKEANLKHRGQVCRLCDPATDQDVFVPGPVIRTVDCPGRPPAAIPPRQSAPAPARKTPSSTIAAQSARSPARLLEGLRVIEVGSLTTGPLCGRMLAALGADVIKVEPPSGDPMRHMPPLQHDQGIFFSYYNTDKKAVSLDLKSEADRRQLAALLGTADVLVQNLKEGAFARMGFTPDRLVAINPRLVRCDISGFGNNSIYHGRPAVDSIVQAMSGIMTANRVGTTPMKTGISFVDLQVAILSFGSVLAALIQRNQTDKGMHVDLAMQDIACWSTQTIWNDAPHPPSSLVIACSNGPVITLAGRDAVESALSGLTSADNNDADFVYPGTYQDALRSLMAAGLESAKLNTVAEALALPQTAARSLHFEVSDPLGNMRPAVRVPIHMSQTQPQTRSVIGPVGHDMATVLNQLTAIDEAPVK